VRIQKTLLALLLSTTLLHPLRTEETEDTAKNTTQFPSPDGQFAFRFGKDESDGEDIQTFDLIDARSGKLVLRIAKTDPDPAPSARFEMEVLWRPDSKAFAVTETLWKRGSDAAVYLQTGAKFREVKLPRLEAVIPEKEKQGKKFQKTTQINSQTAKQWQKDGSLVVDVETQDDGDDGSITATRTVVLGFDKSNKARVLKSSIKFEINKE